MEGGGGTSHVRTFKGYIVFLCIIFFVVVVFTKNMVQIILIIDSGSNIGFNLKPILFQPNFHVFDFL